MAANPSKRVICFSPIGVEATCVEFMNFFHTPGVHTSHEGPVSPYDSREYDAVKARLTKVYGITLGEDDEGEIIYILAAAAGTPEDIERLQAILAPSPLEIPEGLSADTVIGVSKLKYAFQWDSSITTGFVDDILFTLKGGKKKTDGTSPTRLANVFGGKMDPPDTLAVTVERHEGPAGCIVTVVFLRVPDTVPAIIRTTDAVMQRKGIVSLYHSMVKQCITQDVYVENKLGIATFYNIDSPMKSIDLGEVRAMTFLGRQVDIAQHSCVFTMNCAGGSILATTMMLSKGLDLSDKSSEIDMPFHSYRNGYLVFIDSVDTSPMKDDNGALLLSAWVNCPEQYFPK